MATTVHLKNADGVVKTGIVGFSWTTLFFGLFVPLLRGDMKWFFIMLIFGILTLGLVQIIFCFIYNKKYTEALIDKGFYPVDESSKITLQKYGLVVDR